MATGSCAAAAGTVTAMACPDIVMYPGSSIGAAVVYKVGPDGTPELIEEKFESIVRAAWREAAGIGFEARDRGALVGEVREVENLAVPGIAMFPRVEIRELVGMDAEDPLVDRDRESPVIGRGRNFLAGQPDPAVRSFERQHDPRAAIALPS